MEILARLRPYRRAWILIAAIAIGLAAASLVYVATAGQVIVLVDGLEVEVRTHAGTVEGVLRAARVEVSEFDAVDPPIGARVSEDRMISVERAYPVEVEIDGAVMLVHSPARMPSAVLEAAGKKLKPGDWVWADGERVEDPQRDLGRRIERLRIRRGYQVQVRVDGQDLALWTGAPTIGEALWETGVHVFEGDRVEPEPETMIVSPVAVVVERSRAFEIDVDGMVVNTRAVGDTVGEVLADAGVVLVGLDYSQPGVEEGLPEDGRIEVVRVWEEVILEQTPVAYTSVVQPDPELEIDHRRVITPGSYGVRAKRVRVLYENGEEVSRVAEGARLVVEPVKQVVGYGTKIVIRTRQTADGPIQYWRAVRMYATSFSPCRLGVDYCDVDTASGLKLKKGIAAFTVPWFLVMKFNHVYVDGYGEAVIGDTGGGIPGRYWIDLGYSDDDYKSWHHWVTVYFLTPVPDKIMWILE